VSRLCYRAQRTISAPAEVTGTGFLTGATVRLRFLPAGPHTGILFQRSDLRHTPRIAASIDNVTGTDRRTTLGHPPAQVSLVEHVLAALSGLRIDNCVIDVNAPEPPGLDGSCRGFVKVLHEAGICTQAARRPIWVIDHPVLVGQGNVSLAIHPPPGDDLTVSYFLDYGLNSPIVRQLWTGPITPMSFAQELAGCRTFLLEAEAYALRQQGLGSRITPADLLVFGPEGPIDNQLRYANEPARHKALDIVGDLSLLGMDLVGHVTAVRSGHPHNAALVRALQRQLRTACCSERLAA
jgi:UDP-3-O-acyl N-acetylglucosamine deacetylase